VLWALLNNAYHGAKLFDCWGVDSVSHCFVGVADFGATGAGAGFLKLRRSPHFLLRGQNDKVLIIDNEVHWHQFRTMAQPLRMENAGGCYYVINRGNYRQQ
jgi:hypothetical protein